MNKRHIIINILRTLFAFLMIVMNISDIIGIGIDPVTYDAVYTGEFMGKFRFESLKDLIQHRWFTTVKAYIYIYTVFLYTTRFHDNKYLKWCLRGVEIYWVYLFISETFYFWFGPW